MDVFDDTLLREETVLTRLEGREWLIWYNVSSSSSDEFVFEGFLFAIIDTTIFVFVAYFLFL